MTDPLRELSTTDIAELSAFYKDYQDEAPHIHSYLETALKWRTKEPKKCLIQVFAPQEGWTGHGTFVSLLHSTTDMIVTYTLEESGDILRKVLSETQQFDYAQKTILYYALHEKHIPIVNDAMATRGLKKFSQDDTDLWRISREAGLTKTVSVPEGFTIGKLKSEDAEIVNDLWPHKSPGSVSYVRTLIEMNGGCGLYTKDNGILVAWILKSQLGQLALLQVTEEYKRRGLAKAVMDPVIKEISQDGFPVIATIVTHNTASQNLFAKAGFEKLFLARFIIYK